MLVLMDADSSHDPRDIPAVTSPLMEGEADMVVGNRFPRMESGAMSWLNKSGNRVLSWLARGALQVSVYDTQSGFKAFSRELYSCMDLSSEGMPLSTQVLGEARRAGARIAEAPVAYRPRAGKRKLNPLRDGLNILTTILMLARDYRPLAFFGGLGVILALLGGGVGLSVVAEFLETGDVRRQASVTLSALLVLTGVQIFVLGLVADMVKSVRKRRRLH